MSHANDFHARASCAVGRWRLEPTKKAKALGLHCWMLLDGRDQRNLGAAKVSPLDVVARRANGGTLPRRLHFEIALKLWWAILPTQR